MNRNMFACEHLPMKTLKLTVAAVAATGIAALAASPALAVHEANNTVDFAPFNGATMGDAKAVSNFTGGETPWQNQINARDLEAMQTYTWVGIAMGRATEICTFTTDFFGKGRCHSDVNSRLAATEVRLGGVNGPTILRAEGCSPTDPGDADNKTDDGEIERHGTERHPGPPNCAEHPPA
jgi:hypothetical protein